MAAAREGASIHGSLGIHVQLDCLEEYGHLIHCEVSFFYPFAGFGEPEAADHEGTKTVVTSEFRVVLISVSILVNNTKRCELGKRKYRCRV